jgi:hypothetical protein
MGSNAERPCFSEDLLKVSRVTRSLPYVNATYLRVAKHDSLLMSVSVSVNYIKGKKGRLRINLTSRLLKRASREQ